MHLPYWEPWQRTDRGRNLLLSSTSPSPAPWIPLIIGSDWWSRCVVIRMTANLYSASGVLARAGGILAMNDRAPARAARPRSPQVAGGPRLAALHRSRFLLDAARAFSSCADLEPTITSYLFYGRGTFVDLHTDVEDCLCVALISVLVDAGSTIIHPELQAMPRIELLSLREIPKATETCSVAFRRFAFVSVQWMQWIPRRLRRPRARTRPPGRTARALPSGLGLLAASIGQAAPPSLSTGCSDVPACSIAWATSAAIARII